MHQLPWLNQQNVLEDSYPELLDQNGCVTSEELWAVRFSAEGEAGLAAEAG